MGRLLFAIFLVVPFIEIAIFILLGQSIGLWPTLLGVVVTALIGSIVIRLQGVSLIEEIRAYSARGTLPGRQIAEGVMLAVAGALLLTPGYFTDTLGFLFLVPPVRRAIYEFLKSRVTVVSAAGTRGPGGQQPGTGPDPGSQPGFGTYGRGGPQRRDDGVVDLDEDDWRDR